MHILIISFDADPLYMGGVATMTHLLAQGFIDQGHTCALGYLTDSEHPSTFFKDKIKTSKENVEQMRQFGQSHSFDVILSQFCNFDYSLLALLRREHSIVVSVYHSRPMLHSLRIGTLLTLYRKSSNFCHKLYTLSKIALLPIYYFQGRSRSKRAFRDAYRSSDSLVLLSASFYPLLQKIIPWAEKERVKAIGNPVVFDEKFRLQDLDKKQKKVVIVCSANHVKRIPTLFNIWKEIESDAVYQDWSLSFVGAGEGFEQIQSLAQRMKLRRIHFAGYASPLPYYAESSIMLMTSKYEGWPMVLMEGQQMGVVPICYNSFESLTEIIADRHNGIIVANNDQRGFVQALKALMNNPIVRTQLAANAIRSSSKHTKLATINRYLELFSTLLKEKKCHLFITI